MNRPELILFDVYRTLMRVLPRPNPSGFFAGLWVENFPGVQAPEFGEFQTAVNKQVAASHERSRQAGIDFPEVQWPVIVEGALAGFLPDGREVPAGFVAGSAACEREIDLMPGAAPLLQYLRAGGIPCGIVSNAQAYTLDEMSDLLRPHDLDLGQFDPDFIFWSFRHGFSKPSPHVFQIPASRADARGIPREKVLMVGDREDNDIGPARASGFQTWRVDDEECLPKLLSLLQTENQSQL